MKRHICSVVLALVSLLSYAKGLSPEIGRALTYWTESKDSREALVYQILRNNYPDESYYQLAARIDCFHINLQDTGYVLFGIYSYLGPDYAYASLMDGFTRWQLKAIDQFYIDNGGNIPHSRTETERKKKSTEAAQRGISIEMAWNLRKYLNSNPNMVQFAAYQLADEGISDLGIYRIIDNLDENLDFAEEIILGIYNHSGSANEAYYNLKPILTAEQFKTVQSINNAREEQKRVMREKAIEAFKQSVIAREPVAIPQSKLNYYSAKAFAILDQIVRSEACADYDISVRDSIYASSDCFTFTHTIQCSIPDSLEHLRDSIETGIRDIVIEPVPVDNDKLNVRYYASCTGEYSFKYSYHEEIDCYEVRKKRVSSSDKDSFDGLTLISGDENAFLSDRKAIQEYLTQEGLFGKRKVMVKKCIRNEEIDDVHVSQIKKWHLYPGVWR